jgi:RecA/RadA recombinase
MAKAPLKKPTKKAKEDGSFDASSLSDSDFLNSIVDGLYEIGAIATHDNFALFESGMLLADVHNSGFYDPKSKTINFGFPTGRMCQIIGATGIGKTTFAVQVGAGIIKAYPLGQMYYFDGEKAQRRNRLTQITGISNDKRIIHVNKNTNLESLLKMINSIYEMKMNNLDRFQIEVDFNGEKVTVMQPTVVIIDSIASLTKEKMSESADLGSNMEGAQNAIYSNKIIKNVLDKLISANIIVFGINHITININTGITALPRNPIPGLKPEESVSGGSGWRYYADWYVRIHPVKTMSEAKDNLNATLCEIEIIKARTFQTGLRFKMLFDRTNGGVWDDVSSQLEFLIQQGFIKLTGAWYSIDGYAPKFYKASIPKLLETDQAFQTAFYTALENCLIEYLPHLKADELSGIDTVDEEEG